MPPRIIEPSSSSSSSSSDASSPLLMFNSSGGVKYTEVVELDIDDNASNQSGGGEDEDCGINEEEQQQGRGGQSWSSFWCGDSSENESGAPSNETLLSTAFVSFLVFLIAQFFAAVYAKSQAMMADSATMSVDAMTYAFNLCAERRKKSLVAQNLSPRQQRKQRLLLELVPPLISVTALVVITAFVTKDALTTLLVEQDDDDGSDHEPNVTIMFVFPFINLLLDVLNMTCFAKARKLFGFAVFESDNKEEQQHVETERLEPYEHELMEPHETKQDEPQLQEHTRAVVTCPLDIDGSDMSPPPTAAEVQTTQLTPARSIERKSSKEQPLLMNSAGTAVNENRYPSSGMIVEEEDFDDGANLNMCSAYTHVCADTLRSVSVVIAATLAACVDGIDPEVADASAALLVTVLIVLSLIPLLRGLLLTWSELRKTVEDIEMEEEGGVRRVEHELLLDSGVMLEGGGAPMRQVQQLEEVV